MSSIVESVGTGIEYGMFSYVCLVRGGDIFSQVCSQERSSPHDAMEQAGRRSPPSDGKEEAGSSPSFQRKEQSRKEAYNSRFF